MQAAIIARKISPDIVECVPSETAISIACMLSNVPLFAGPSEDTLERLASFAFRRTFAKAELIVEEGRTANGLFIVIDGQVDIVKGRAGEQSKVVATLGAAEPIGEMEILAEWPRTASGVAVTWTECLGMDSWVFMDYLHHEPQLAIRLAQILAKRLAKTSERLAC